MKNAEEIYPIYKPQFHCDNCNMETCKTIQNKFFELALMNVDWKDFPPYSDAYYYYSTLEDILTMIRTECIKLDIERQRKESEQRIQGESNERTKYERRN